jgi:hypothetical protein
LAIAEGRAMLAAFRAERGMDDAEKVSLADAILSLLHTARAAGQDATDVAAEVMAAVGDFWTEAGQEVVEPPVNARLSCNLRGRLDAIERAAVAGDNAGARRDLLALLKFFPKAPR